MKSQVVGAELEVDFGVGSFGSGQPISLYISESTLLCESTHCCGGVIMKRVTFSIPRELKARLEKYPDINWAGVAKKGIEDKLDKLRKFEELENRGEL